MLAGLLVAGTFAATPSSSSAGADAAADDPSAVDPFEVELLYSGLGNVRLGQKFGVGGGDDELLDIELFASIPGGVPDDVIMNLSTRGFAPPPAPCITASETSVRCPLKDLRGMFVDLGSGDDDVRSDAGTFLDGFGKPIRLVFELGRGNDRFTGGIEDDITMGGPGDDRVRTGDGQDRLIGGRGDDRLFGGPDVDFFMGGPGNDLGRGGGGNDKGRGGPGDDDFKD